MARWLLAALTLAVPAVAPADGSASSDATGPRPGPNFYVLPTPFYLPETRFGLAVVAGLHLVTCRQCEVSSVELQAAYTLNRQSMLEARTQLFPTERLALAGRAKYGHFPDRFYGIGPSTPAVGEPYTARAVNVELSAERALLPQRLRAGPTAHLHWQDVLAREEGGLLARQAVAGAGRVAVVGLGATAIWDDRDSRFFPTRGTFASASGAWYVGDMQGRASFGRAVLDLRRVVPLAPRHALALQLRGEATRGAVPFALLPRLGGESLLRGYAAGRYRDSALWAAQAEYRLPLVGRLGGVLFGGAGGVAPSPAAFSVRHARLAGGAGLRLRLTDDGVNARLDVATTGDSVSVYAFVLEAF